MPLGPSSPSPFVAVRFGRNDAAAGTGIGETSIGRKLRRFCALGVTVGTPRRLPGGESVFDDGVGDLEVEVSGNSFSGIGGGDTFKRSVDELLLRLGERDSCSSAPVVDIRTSILGVPEVPVAR